MTADRGAAFRALHRPGAPFVLANAWDLGSARMLAALGAEAIATTSSGFAFTLGRPDMGHVSRDEMLGHCSDLVSAVNLPVSGDLENGYGDAPEAVAETVRLAHEAGLAGCSIEDVAPPGGAAYDRTLAVERIRAAAAAVRALPRDFVLVARADGVLTKAYGMDEALIRVRAFREAGAECLYVPLPPDLEALSAIIAAADGHPVNALAAGPFAALTRAEFARAGVARISLGGALARATHEVIATWAAAIREDGRFNATPSMSGDLVDALLTQAKHSP
ncbi:MAG: isocitrate lyase/phosphoenolpyruvate mutase family protein [Pseudomonadota bacterium]